MEKEEKLKRKFSEAITNIKTELDKKPDCVAPHWKFERQSIYGTLDADKIARHVAYFGDRFPAIIDIESLSGVRVNIYINDKGIRFEVFETCPRIVFSENMDEKNPIFLNNKEFGGSAEYNEEKQKLTFYATSGKKSKGKDFLNMIMRKNIIMNETPQSIVEKIRNTSLKINKNGCLDFVDTTNETEFVRTMIFYLNAISIEPLVENIYKGGFDKYIKGILYKKAVSNIDSTVVDFKKLDEFSKFLSIINNNRKDNSLKNILNCPTFILNELKKDEYSKYFVSILLFIQEESVKKQITPSNVSMILKYWVQSRTNISLIKECGYDLERLALYCFKTALLGEYRIPEINLKLLHNYKNYQDVVHINNTQKMGLNIENIYEKYPKDIRVVERNVSKYYEIIKDKALDKKFAMASAKNRCRDDVIDGYIIKSPRNIKDMTDEGSSMHHCVGGYIQRYITGENTVYFMRKSEEPKKSYITFDIANNRLNQYVMEYDKPVSDDKALIALKKWCKKNDISCSIRN